MVKSLYLNSEIGIFTCNICKNSLSATVPSEDLRALWREVTAIVFTCSKMETFVLLFLRQEDFIHDDRGYWIIDPTKF